MILTKQDAQYASQVFIDYYKNFGRIDDYLRKVKLERMEDMPTPLFGYGPEDEMFQDNHTNNKLSQERITILKRNWSIPSSVTKLYMLHS